MEHSRRVSPSSSLRPGTPTGERLPPIAAFNLCPRAAVRSLPGFSHRVVLLQSCITAPLPGVTYIGGGL